MKEMIIEKKNLLRDRGTITHMERDANPNYLMYTHVKIRPQVNIKEILKKANSPEASPERDEQSFLDKVTKRDLTIQKK